MRVARMLALALLCLPAAAGAEDWPTRPIRFIQGFAPGGTTDIVARLLAVPLGAELGQPVVVDNRPGAGGTIGADALAKSKPDGYTMMLINSGYTVAAALYRQLPYDPVRDIETAGLVATMGLVLIAPAHAGSLGEVVARARANPGRLNIGSVGVGSTQHLAAAVFESMSGARLSHVPYRSTPAAVTALRGGEVDLVMETTSAVLGQVRSGDVKALAVTSKARFPGLPNVPTMAEAGIAGVEIESWYGITFPTSTPRAVIDRANRAIAAALRSPELLRGFGELGLVSTGGGTPEQMADFVRAEIGRWSALIESAKIERQ